MCSAELQNFYEDSINEESSPFSCIKDSVLRCKADRKNGVKYRAVTWYKVNKDPPYQLSGLLTRKLSRPNSTRCYICLQREVHFLEESFDIFLPNVTSDDIGTYKCLLEAHVGEQNQEGLDHISVAGCPGNKLMGQINDMYLVVAATVVLIVALMIFVVCYATLKSILNQRLKKNFKERLLDTHVGKNDLESINTLGSCWSRQATKPTTMKYMCG